MNDNPHALLDIEASRAPFLDRFLPRMLANSFAMVGVAMATWWLVDSQNASHEQALTDARDQAQLMRHERDRMQDLNRELAREVHDAGVASEIGRWQLRWTEERLRRLEAETQQKARPPVGWPEAAVPFDSSGGTDSPAIQALDAPAAAFLGGRVAEIQDRAWDELIGAGGTAEGAGAEGAHRLGGSAGLTDGERLVRLDGPDRADAHGGLDAVAFDPTIPALRRPNSQRDRDRAVSAWKDILTETARVECDNRFSETARWRCEEAAQRSLWQYSTLGVNCILSGNAVPDYVSGLSLDKLPSDSVPLERGALILCDGALANL
mgnify:CR=1 FL=1